MAGRRRLDGELVRRGLAESRTQAAELIGSGLVTVAGAPATKPARLVAPDEPVVVAGPPRRYVSRGGEKLRAALDRFGIDPSGADAVDVGSSTGGFTDCLLQAGALRVTAVDVGRAQLHQRLRDDPRVTSVERTDVRAWAGRDPRAGRYPLVVADLSFISLRTVAEALLTLCAPGADVVVLVKPQFEAGRREVSKGAGVIRDPAVREEALRGALTAMEASGAAIMGVMVSPLRGAEGNVEFLAHLRAGGSSVLTPAAAATAAAAEAG